MTLIYRYIFFSIIQSTVAVTLVLLAIVTSGRLAKYLNQASSGDLAPELVFTIILFRIPDFLPLILPLGLFIGTLLVFGRMYIDSELTALNAAGVSKIQMLILTLLPAAFVSVFVAALTLWLAPASLTKVESTLQSAQDTDALLLIREGNFQSSRDGRSVAYLERVLNGNQLEGIFVIEQLDGGRLGLMLAEKGTLTENANISQRTIELENGRIYEGEIGQRDYRVSSFDSYRQNIRLQQESEMSDLEIDARSTLSILGENSPEIKAALQWRFSLPTSVLVVSVLALALSRTDRRQGRFTKMLPAIAIYLVYIVLLSAVRSAIETQTVITSALWVVHLLFMLFSLSLFFADELKQLFFLRRARS